MDGNLEAGPSRRTTRRSTAKGGRIKLKVNQDTQGGMAQYMQGYDRELDSDKEEPMAFEEQFILRMPPGEDCDRLREMVEKREVNGDEVWFKFKDSRRAVMNVGNTMYGAKLVDLPCIIESQKTFDNKHTFKVADICQMLVVDDWPIDDESTITRGAFNIEDFIYPHGITPPLRHVRKRRFRKRLNKRTIENVERAVERLLEEDARASQVIVEVVDNARDLSDSEGEYFGPETPAPYGSVVATPAADSIGAPTPAADSEAGDQENRYEEEDDDDHSIDSDLAAEIEAGLMETAAEEAKAAARAANQGEEDDEQDDDDDGDSDGGLFGGDDDDDDEEEDEEVDDGLDEERQRVRLLQGEVKDLESVVVRKKAEISKAANVILRKRFEENLRKLASELEAKKAQLVTAQADLDAGTRRKGAPEENAVGEPGSSGEGGEGGEAPGDGMASGAEGISPMPPTPLTGTTPLPPPPAADTPGKDAMEVDAVPLTLPTLG